MDIWIFLWKAFFLITLALFAAMSVWVSIGGYHDLKLLFRKMDEANKLAGDDDEE